MSGGGGGGTGLDNDYGVKGVVWHLPRPVHPSRPYNLYQDHYKGILPGPPTFPGSPPPPSGTSLQLTLPTTGSCASPSTSLHILKGAYQVPGPGLSPAIMPGWWGGLAARLPRSLSHSSVSQGFFYVGSADCLTKWQCRLFSLVYGFMCPCHHTPVPGSTSRE